MVGHSPMIGTTNATDGDIRELMEIARALGDDADVLIADTPGGDDDSLVEDHLEWAWMRLSSARTASAEFAADKRLEQALRRGRKAIKGAQHATAVDDAGLDQLQDEIRKEFVEPLAEIVED